MAIQGYLSVKGSKQGQFKGEGAQSKRKDRWMPVQGLTMGVKSPRDIATGQPSGKRQYEPVSIVKEWGAASPQGLTACSTNEVLPEVLIEFIKPNVSGEEIVYQTIKLTDATIAEVSRFTSAQDATARPPSSSAPELERWAFTFRRIEVEDKEGKTAFEDDWARTT